MKSYKPARAKPPHHVILELTPAELGRVTGGDGVLAVETLEQHVDNPGQTAMKA